MGTSDQRRHPRISVDFFADWGWAPTCEYYDRVTSLSIRGCFLATRRELQPGQEIYLKMSGDTIGTINLKGAVRHQFRMMDGVPPTGAGIEFLDVSPECESRLRAIIDGTR